MRERLGFGSRESGLGAATAAVRRSRHCAGRCAQRHPLPFEWRAAPSRLKQRALTEVLNLSINDTMSRTLMTSGTTLLALVILLVLGGDVIRGFVFAMTWGIVVGTYSSVFVASQILVFLGVKRDWSKGGTAEGPSGTRFAGKDGTGA